MADAIKLTNKTILESTGPILSLSQLKLPAKAAYAIAKAANKLFDIEKTVRDVQQKLWNKYGEKDESGKLKVDPTNNTITIPVAQRDAFGKEFEDLMAETNEITGVRKLSIAELGDVKIEASTLGQLEWFIKDE